jgi:hypothetical protein
MDFEALRGANVAGGRPAEVCLLEALRQAVEENSVASTVSAVLTPGAL